jgi:Mce-associated membrane protein
MKWLPSRTVLVLAATIVVAAGLTGAAWLSTHRAQAQERASSEALAAAAAAAPAIFSYDYRGYDASVANGKLFVTGDFAKEYAETTTSLKPAAAKEQAIVRAQVSSAGVVQASTAQVEVLLYVNQYRRNVNITGEKVDQNRVVLTLVPVDGEWKVSHALAI